MTPTVVTETIRRVFAADESVFLEIGSWSESPTTTLELRSIGEDNLEWFGPLNISMSPNFARELGKALIASADEMDDKNA